MLIRDIDRSLLPRTRTNNKARGETPMRKTAEGLGSFLDRLSGSVRESRARAAAAHSDTVDGEIRAHSRSPMRSFKWPMPQEDGEDASVAVSAPAVAFTLSDEQNQAVDKLREARGIASDAISPAMPHEERVIMQERLKQLFLDISSERSNILSSMSEGKENPEEFPLSIMLPELARTSYSAIDTMIMQFLEAETANLAGGMKSEHEGVLSATEQLKEFMLNEGPAKAFSRFREINRDNVLGLIQQ